MDPSLPGVVCRRTLLRCLNIKFVVWLFIFGLKSHKHNETRKNYMYKLVINTLTLKAESYNVCIFFHLKIEHKNEEATEEEMRK